MADKLTFSGMTWDILEQKYGLRSDERLLFEDCEPTEPSAILLGTVQRARRARLTNERARAYRLIDPVLAELETFYEGKITTIPEMYLEVKDVEGLSGNPDFVISAGTLNRFVPLVAVVEAKKDDVDPGLPQCAAELYAAYLLDKGALRRVYGCVTTGGDWKFLYVDGDDKRIVVDRSTYYITELSRLLGVFRRIVDTSLAALEGR
ncbi:MAG: hypothetical protein U0359_26780 [Byssovorax sp.]